MRLFHHCWPPDGAQEPWDELSDFSHLCSFLSLLWISLPFTYFVLIYRISFSFVLLTSAQQFFIKWPNTEGTFLWSFTVKCFTSATNTPVVNMKKAHSTYNMLFRRTLYTLWKNNIKECKYYVLASLTVIHIFYNHTYWTLAKLQMYCWTLNVFLNTVIHFTIHIDTFSINIFRHICCFKKSTLNCE